MKYIDCYPNNSGGYICLGCNVNQGGPFNWHEDITWATPSDYACSQWHAAQVGGGTIRPQIDANAVPNRRNNGLRRKFSGFTRGYNIYGYNTPYSPIPGGCQPPKCLVNGKCELCGARQRPVCSSDADCFETEKCVGGRCVHGLPQERINRRITRRR